MGRYSELVDEGYRSWNAGAREWVLDHMTSDVEWIPPPDDPDARVYHGHRGVEEFWSQWRDAVGQLHFEVEEIEQHGDDVLVTARRRGKGAHSGLEVSDQILQIFSFNDEGKVCRVREYYDRAQALPVLEGREAG